MTKAKLGLYIHIPFCEQKCNYCDFNSFKCSSFEIEKYLDSLILEIKRESKNYTNYIIDTIFIGGGTPSTLTTKEITILDSSLKKHFTISSNLEYTLECNPNSIDLDKLITYKYLGINRLSIGAQSFIDEELKLLGRIHNKKDIYNSVNLAKSVGFENINIDLMLGIPKQSFNSLKFTLNETINLGVEHISCYSLIIEDNTKFGELDKQDKLLNLPSEETERKFYYLAREILEGNGFNQYEISNFSQSGHKSKHNLKYWNCNNYLGLGLGSHSKIGNKRFENVSNMKRYIELNSNNKSSYINEEILSKKDLINEKIIMGLRLVEGIDCSEFNSLFDIDFLDEYNLEIKKNLQLELITMDNDRIFLTEKGMDYSNLVELDFYR